MVMQKWQKLKMSFRKKKYIAVTWITSQLLRNACLLQGTPHHQSTRWCLFESEWRDAHWSASVRVTFNFLIITFSSIRVLRNEIILLIGIQPLLMITCASARGSSFSAFFHSIRTLGGSGVLGGKAILALSGYSRYFSQVKLADQSGRYLPHSRT